MAADKLEPLRPGEETLCRRVVETLGMVWSLPIEAAGGCADALQWMLDAQGATHFTALELTTVPPDKTALAHRLGFDALLPPRQWWPRVAALCAVLEHVRAAAGGAPIQVRWVWRPCAINRAVRGAPGSDHLEARAADCYWPGEHHRAAADEALRELQAAHPWLALAVGTGRTMLHVGVLRPGGSARWSY
jgi:hypothetical protein